ncbi:MAG: hypothetical protein F2942_05360 [Actinobacteria bacterium]|uniref:Unannotated protein n=1 Tax=freshwater metagenome TaxID=449393 RepID=A0A6J7UL97_9ZZZZ|nr:hypothetical protein [Actinomycetota bacterium]MSY22428.1 hypothetical protein [Actinomycetota bacterium]MTA74125.1 hypothetical protein [Actinomycetota bacterium]
MNRCPSCDSEVTGPFCSKCGTKNSQSEPTVSVPTVPAPAPGPYAVPSPQPMAPNLPPSSQPGYGPGQGLPPSGGSSSSGRIAAISAAATLAVIVIIGGAFLIGRSGGTSPDKTSATATGLEEPPTTTSTTAAPATTTSAVTVPVPAPPVTAAPIGDVRSAAPDLFCRDLKALGYSYSAAVDYWRLYGQPNRMDEDKNGIPCETVFSRSDVVAYWPSTVYNNSISYGLPSGLLCRDLESRGVGVYDALRYYIWEGYPSRMDADSNGIPCETVYPDAAEVWLYEF